MENKERIKRLEKQVEELQQDIGILASRPSPPKKPLNGWCVPIDDDDELKKIIVLYKDDKHIHMLNAEGDPFILEKDEVLTCNYRQATPEEIEERLFNSEQCQKYIGADYDCVANPTITLKGEHEEFIFGSNNSIWAHFFEDGANMICDEHGNWAEIRDKENANEEHLQIKIFDNISADNVSECNDFLKEIGTRVQEVKTEYSTILGGVIYIVSYWC